MNAINKTAASLILGGLLCAAAAPAEAGRGHHSDAAWAGFGFAAGVVTGSLITDHHYRDRDCRPPRYYDPYCYYPRPVYRPVYRPYCPPPRPVVICPPPRPRPVVIYDSSPIVYHSSEPTVIYRTEQPVVYRSEPSTVIVENNQPASYQSYTEERVWPFYRKVESEVIPVLPSPSGNSQAVSIADRYRSQSVAAAPAQQSNVNITINAEKAEVKSDVPVESNPPAEPSTGTSSTVTRSNQSGVVRVAYPSRVADSAPRATQDASGTWREFSGARSEPAPAAVRYVDVSTEGHRAVPSNASQGAGTWF